MKAYFDAIGFCAVVGFLGGFDVLPLAVAFVPHRSYVWMHQDLADNQRGSWYATAAVDCHSQHRSADPG